jgi:hypothetical protein
MRTTSAVFERKTRPRILTFILTGVLEISFLPHRRPTESEKKAGLKAFSTPHGVGEKM